MKSFLILFLLLAHSVMSAEDQAKMCLSEGSHWIRHFSEELGGGHKWDSSKKQSFQKENFCCLNWMPRNSPNRRPFNCQDSMNCHARDVSESEAITVLEFMSSLELLGIPNVLIQTNDSMIPRTDKVRCLSYWHTDQRDPRKELDFDLPLPGTIYRSGDKQVSPENDPFGVGISIPDETLYGIGFYRAHKMEHFSKELKKVFSENEFSCCLPTQKEEFDRTIVASDCCTGTKPNGINRCCLPDYTNLTVYLNQYVSSEAKELPAALFDHLTGRIKDPFVIMEMAESKGMCCSGEVGIGKVVGLYSIPGLEDRGDLSRRFISHNNDRNTSFYDYGQRWNTDVYCVPSSEFPPGSGSSGETSSGKR